MFIKVALESALFNKRHASTDDDKNDSPGNDRDSLNMTKNVIDYHDSVEQMIEY